MTTPYQKGVRAEYLLANELRAQGWTVIRSAGSKGPADLVAWREPVVLIIQVKRCRTHGGLKRAIRESIAKFEEAGVWEAPFFAFEIWLRFELDWVRLRRYSSHWALWSEHFHELGQKEWPITEQEE